ncbi:M48 family metalloprotease [Thalassospiraceae bacterium LMO-JJ14]|nr:M48 family metalloprotease [Thalassospiraceae bacterium LMO-JJ14]
MAVSGCTTNRATGEQSFTAFMSEEDEQRVGAEEHPKMLEAFGGTYDDRTLQAYVSAIGKKLVAQSETPNAQFQFFVLNDDTVNAFALPGGYVYISRGLIALCEDEAELAGVIGHEIGHVTARHSAQRYSSAMATNLGLAAVGILGSVFGAPSGVGDVISYGAQAALQSYSRTQELEADRLGARYMTRASYDPSALTDFFAKLDLQNGIEAEKAGRPKDNFSIMSTHPRTTQRIDQARELAATERPTSPVRQRNLFLTQVDGLLFGKDPKEGFLQGDTFIHPDLGFRFEFPPGFDVKNGKTNVVGNDNKGTTIIFDMENPKVATGMPNLSDYIGRHWGPKSGIKPDNLERLTINGLDAATGTARVDTNKGVRDIRLLAIRGGRESLFRFAFLTDPAVTSQMSVPLRTTTYSFRLLKAGEGDDIKPPHIRLRTVKAGDTPKSFAARMPLGKYNDDWFRALNLNVVSDGLAVGERVKVVGN